MGKIRNVRRIVTGTNQVDGAGVKLVRVLGPDTTQEFDPFLMLDAFDSRNPADYTKGFPWHPHRGIETVTYLIEGDIEHGDSLGNNGRILDGGCQWMTAGSGIIHQEMPQARPRMLGLQLWVNLPRKDKWVRPQYRDIKAAMIPKVDEAPGTVGVISGAYGQANGATQGDYVKALLLDVALKPEATWNLPTDPQSTLFIYIVDGEGSFGGAKPSVKSRRAVLFHEGDEFAVQAGPTGMRFVLAAGRPLREPIAWGGPIVMNTQEELDQAFAELDNKTFIRE
ncbi:MAG: pirin family protein [Kiritimatiellae bacterium]|nr:pirin family protein [Kiritimatiellia bacterium]